MLSKEEKQSIIMKYIENIVISKNDGNLTIEKINFRNSYISELNELFINNGYDLNITCIDKNGNKKIPGLSAMATNKLEEQITRLRKFYDVDYYESKLNNDSVIIIDGKPNSEIAKLVLLTDKNNLVKSKNDDITCGVITTTQGINMYK